MKRTFVRIVSSALLTCFLTGSLWAAEPVPEDDPPIWEIFTSGLHAGHTEVGLFANRPVLPDLEYLGCDLLYEHPVTHARCFAFYWLNLNTGSEFTEYGTGCVT